MKKRRFKKYSEKDQIRLLLSALWSALNEKRSRKTDIYGLAKQYYSFLRREDFDIIKNMTIEEIVNKLDKNEIFI